MCADRPAPDHPAAPPEIERAVNALDFDTIRALWEAVEIDGRHPDPRPTPLMLVALKQFADNVLYTATERAKAAR